MPVEPFDDGLWLTPRVDHYSRVTVRQCHYSVPAKLIGRTVRVSLRASEVVILDGKREVARHARQVRKGAQRRAPTRASGQEMVWALDRVSEIVSLGADQVLVEAAHALGAVSHDVHSSCLGRS